MECQEGRGGLAIGAAVICSSGLALREELSLRDGTALEHVGKKAGNEIWGADEQKGRIGFLRLHEISLMQAHEEQERSTQSFLCATLFRLIMRTQNCPPCWGQFCVLILLERL